MQIKNFKKYLVLIAVLGVATCIIFFTLKPLFNTGIILSTNSTETYLRFDGVDYENDANIPLQPGEYTATVLEGDHKHKEMSFRVKRYGLTALRVEGGFQMKTLREELPYFETTSETPFEIKMKYNGYIEPTFIVTLWNTSDKGPAIRWLRSRGITSESYEIFYQEDGE